MILMIQVSIVLIWIVVHLKEHSLSFLTHFESYQKNVFSLFCVCVKLNAYFGGRTVYKRYENLFYENFCIFIEDTKFLKNLCSYLKQICLNENIILMSLFQYVWDVISQGVQRTLNDVKIIHFKKDIWNSSTIVKFSKILSLDHYSMNVQKFS